MRNPAPTPTCALRNESGVQTNKSTRCAESSLAIFVASYAQWTRPPRLVEDGKVICNPFFFMWCSMNSVHRLGNNSTVVTLTRKHQKWRESGSWGLLIKPQEYLHCPPSSDGHVRWPANDLPCFLFYSDTTHSGIDYY